MDAMTKFMDKSDNITVLKNKRRRGQGRGSGEAAQQSCGGVLARSVFSCEALQDIRVEFVVGMRYLQEPDCSRMHFLACHHD